MLRVVARRRLWFAFGLLISVLFVMGLTAIATVQRDTTAPPASHPSFGQVNHAAQPPFNTDLTLTALSEPDVRHGDDVINAAANQLFASVNHTVATNVHVTDFAREKIAWILTKKQAGTLSVTLLKDAKSADLGLDDLMAAGYVRHKPVIVIAQPRFVGLLVDGGRMVAPFRPQQVNDFMLGLVHETVHLQNPNLGHLVSSDDRMNEELRTWREVDVGVVQALRAAQEPMDTRFLEVDDALRACGDRQPCKPLRELLFPDTRRR
jgi:hypothetical protein